MQQQKYLSHNQHNVYNAFCKSENREIQLTQLGGKNNLCTLYKNNVIGLTDISPGNVLQISLSGSVINIILQVRWLLNLLNLNLLKFYKDLTYVVYLLNAHNNISSMQQF